MLGSDPMFLPLLLDGGQLLGTLFPDLLQLDLLELKKL